MIKRVDSGGQVHLVTNIRKPRKWRRYEYLLSSGTLYIDTGFIPNNNDKMEITFIPLSNSVNLAIFGCRAVTNNNSLLSYNVFLMENGSTLRLDIVNGSSTYAVNTRYTLKYENSVVNVNGTNITGPARDGSSVGYKLYLFGTNTAGELLFLSSIKMYNYKLYSNGTLVRDFVPAEYNGQYGMWDLVEDKFYPNKGTGTFTVGPEMKNYDEIYEVRKTTSLLPSGVELYDYILSSGTLYIDSGIIANQYPIELKTNLCYTNNAANEEDFFGNFSGGNPSTCFVCGKTNSNKFYQWGGSAFYAGSVVLNLFYELSFNYTGASGRTITIDGTANTSTANNGFTSRIDTIGVFSGASTRAYCAASVKMKYAQIKINNVVVRNFIPCTYLGEPGMWDTVENKFYRSQGTGLFTLGNKITLKEYEYLQGDGVSCYIDTGFYPNNNTHIKTSVLVSTVGDGTFLVYGAGGRSYTDRTFELYDWSNKTLYNYGALTLYLLTPPLNTWLEIEHNKNQVSCNGTTGTITANTFTSPTTMHLFALHRSSATTFGYKSNIKMLYFKLWDNDTLIRDYVPVSYNGTPGLWDKVEWKFYANAGSGSFTLGPEKASGSIYLHSHLTNLFNGFVAGGLMTLSNGVLIGTGANSDTYFYTKTKQAVNTTSYYLVGLYVQGYSSASSWNFLSPQNNSAASIKIIRDGWNWGYVKFSTSSSLPIWDDLGTRPSPIPKITISDCRIYKIT